MSDVKPFASLTATCNQYGEYPLTNAPKVTLSNGIHAVPSQYLNVTRTLEFVENIINDIEFDEAFPVFVGTRNNMLYLQVGVIGYENYPKGKPDTDKQKIVYGRPWYIEPMAPTSEIVQTACLAIKKAREHELREKFKLQLNNNENIATPFNSHIDAVLMSRDKTFFQPKIKCDFEVEIREIFKRLQLNKLSFQLNQIHEHTGDQYIVDITIASSKEEILFPDFAGLSFSLLCQKDSHSAFLHELMARLIHLSDRYVEEQFQFREFNRFSYQHCPQTIAQFSLNSRLLEQSDQAFWQDFEDMSYKMDSERVPPISENSLGKKLKKSLAKFSHLHGYLPQGF